MCLCREVENLLTKLIEERKGVPYERAMLTFDAHVDSDGNRRVSCSIEEAHYGEATNVSGAWEQASRARYLARTPTAVHQ